MITALKKTISKSSLMKKLPIPRLSFPTELEFEPIQLCNAKCFTCPYSRLSESKEYLGKKMERDQIEDLLDQFGKLIKKNSYNGESHVNPFRYSDPLVCKDLDIVFNKANLYKFKVRITTNGVSLNEKYLGILNDNLENLEEFIRISLIGHDKETVKKYMNLNLDLTINRFKYAKKNYPEVFKKILVTMSEVDNSPEEQNGIELLKKEFDILGLNYKVRKDWIHNRIVGEWVKPELLDKHEQDEENYIRGCILYQNKLIRRIQVMYNGNVVLCDDDAEGKLVFGNVFNEGLENIWNGSLLDYHKLIYKKEFDSKKKDLICNTCSRAMITSKPNGINTLRHYGITNFVKYFFNANTKKI